MKDKEFEQLLQDSIRTHGRKYLSADDDRNHIPILPHTFPDDFLSDVVLPSQQPKKPVFRVIRILSACAAVLVLMTAIAVIPMLLRTRQSVGMESPATSRSVLPSLPDPVAADSHDALNTDISKTSSAQPMPSQNVQTPHTAETAETSENPAKSMDGYSDVPDHTQEQDGVKAEEPAREISRSSAEESAAFENEVSEAPTDELAVDDDTFLLPVQAEAELMSGQTFFRLSRPNVTALAMTLADAMRPVHQQTDTVLPAQEDTIIFFTLSTQDTMYLYGNPYQKIQVYVTEQAMAITGTHDGEITCYWISCDDSDYEAFCSMVQLLTENGSA